ncbi:hypothetical protein [Pseudozobellia thermophila]|nr:hypothetical protein [Pseudozobellia thermophila]
MKTKYLKKQGLGGKLRQKAKNRFSDSNFIVFLTTTNSLTID